MRGHYTPSRCINPVAMLISSHVFTHGAPDRFLHRDALGFSPLLKSELLLMREPESHGHGQMVSD